MPSLTLGTFFCKQLYDNLNFPGQLGVGAAVGTTIVVVTVFIIIVIIITVTTLVILIMTYRKRIGHYFVPEGNVVVLLTQVYMLVACLANYLEEL